MTSARDTTGALSVSIRAAGADDFDVWLRLWRAYQAFYHVDIPHDTTLTTWQRILDPAEPVHAALATVDDRTCGLVHFIEHRSTWATAHYTYLHDLFADPAVRGRGVGRALIEHVYAEAAAGGCSRVWWLTHETNETAMRLYDVVAERTGFVQYRKVL